MLKKLTHQVHFQTQVQVASIPGGVGGSTVIEFWLKILSHLPRWYQDRSVSILTLHVLCSRFLHLDGDIQTVNFHCNVCSVRNILYVVDSVLKVAFRIPASAEMVSAFFSEQYQVVNLVCSDMTV